MELIKVFIHDKTPNKKAENFMWEFNYIPHKHDRFSLSKEGRIYEVDYTIFNYFDCEYKVEVFVHQI